jgi:hypothetical protein
MPTHLASLEHTTRAMSTSPPLLFPLVPSCKSATKQVPQVPYPVPLVCVLVYGPTTCGTPGCDYTEFLKSSKSAGVSWPGKHAKRKNMKCQHRYKDFGTTGGQYTTCVGSKSGMATPAKKAGSKNVCIVDAMLALFELTREAKFKWLPKGSVPSIATTRMTCIMFLLTSSTRIVLFPHLLLVLQT